MVCKMLSKLLCGFRLHIIHYFNSDIDVDDNTSVPKILSKVISVSLG